MEKLIDEAIFRIEIYDTVISDLLECRVNADYNTIKEINKKIDKYSELKDSCERWLKAYQE